MGATAQDIRAHLVALTHNLLLLFRETLGREHGIKEEKVERKHAEQRKRPVNRIYCARRSWCRMGR